MILARVASSPIPRPSGEDSEGAHAQDFHVGEPVARQVCIYGIRDEVLIVLTGSSSSSLLLLLM